MPSRAPGSVNARKADAGIEPVPRGQSRGCVRAGPSGRAGGRSGWHEDGLMGSGAGEGCVGRAGSAEMTGKISSRPFRVLSRSLRLHLAVVAACLFIFSCGNSGKDLPYSNNENILHFDVPSPMRSLDPRDDLEHGGKSVLVLLFSHLFLVGDGGEILPELAVQWSFDPGKLTWTLHLRENAFFHDGMRVTSRDVARSVERYAGEDVHPIRPEVEKMTPLSETSLAFILKWNDPDFLWKIARIEILPANVPERTDPFIPPVGSGPFRFDRRTGEEEVRLVANDDYYLGRPFLDGIVFHYIEDRERSWARFLSGRTDIATEIYPKDREMMERYRGRAHFSERVRQSYTLLLYNVSDPLFRDLRVRRALSHAVNTEHIVQKILRGFGVPARSPAGVNSPYADEGVVPPPYDPQKSRELLMEAGWVLDEADRCFTKDGKRFEFTISVFDGDQTHRKVAEYLQLCFNDVGVRAHIEALPYPELIRRYAGNSQFQAALTEFMGAYQNPVIMAHLWASSRGRGSNAGCFTDSGVTDLLSGALRETDPDRRKELVRRADALIASLQPATFLYHKSAFDVMSGRISAASPFSFDILHIYQLKDARIVVR